MTYIMQYGKSGEINRREHFQDSSSEKEYFRKNVDLLHNACFTKVLKNKYKYIRVCLKISKSH